MSFKGRGVGPKYPLERVVAVAVDGGDVMLGQTRARAIVETYVDGLVEAEAFARAVVAGLRREHFEETVDLAEPPYRGSFDVYITPLSPALIARHGLEHVATWYVKLKLVESDEAASVVCVSLHPPEKPSKKTRRNA